MFTTCGIYIFDDTDRNEILGTTVDKYTLVRDDRNWCAITTVGIG